MLLLVTGKTKLRKRLKKKFPLHAKLIYLQTILSFQIVRYGFKYLRYNRKILKYRLPLYFLYSHIICFTLQKIALISPEQKTIVKFFGLYNEM